MASILFAVFPFSVILWSKLLLRNEHIGIYKILGSVLGFMILEAMVLYFTAYPMEFPDWNVTPVVDTGMLIENTLLLFVSSAIAGFIPAWRITRENILDAMRGN